MPDRRIWTRPPLGFQTHVFVPVLISALALIATACGGGDADAGLTWTVSAGAPPTAPTTTTEAPDETATPSTEATAPGDAATPSTTTAATETETTTTTPGGGREPQGPPANDELLAKGKIIFEETAGGVGCASCHGFDGRGTPNGPNIISLTRTAIAGAAGGGVPDMADIKLTGDELDAVAAYLATLTS